MVEASYHRFRLLAHCGRFAVLRNLAKCQRRRELQKNDAPQKSHIITSAIHSLRSNRRLYFFRSTRNRASSFSVSACSPKLSSSAKASFTSASALLTDASTPNSAGYVAFSDAVSLPAVFPSCSEVWVTSS